jgi:hypothetical protein
MWSATGIWTAKPGDASIKEGSLLGTDPPPCPSLVWRGVITFQDEKSTIIRVIRVRKITHEIRTMKIRVLRTKGEEK